LERARIAHLAVTALLAVVSKAVEESQRRQDRPDDR
jgi:hypothetical protein